jgi:hypothetical protein
MPDRNSDGRSPIYIILDNITYKINFPASLVAHASDGTAKHYLKIESFILSHGYEVRKIAGKLVYVAL